MGKNTQEQAIVESLHQIITGLYRLLFIQVFKTFSESILMYVM